MTFCANLHSSIDDKAETTRKIDLQQIRTANGCPLTKVIKVMARDVPRVDYNDTVLNACRIILGKNHTGAVVVQGERVVGMLTARGLLRVFIPLDRRASEVKVSEVVTPILKIDKNASTEEAARKLVDAGFSRACVFDEDKLIGWVTLTDMARGSTKRNVVRALLSGHEPEEVFCPVCKVGLLEKQTDLNGVVVRWDCTNCSYSM